MCKFGYLERNFILDWSMYRVETDVIQRHVVLRLISTLFAISSLCWTTFPLFVSCGDDFRSGLTWCAVIFHPAFGSVTHECANRLQACINHYFLCKMSNKSNGMNLMETWLHTWRPTLRAVGDMASASWRCWQFTMLTSGRLQISMRPWSQRRGLGDTAYVW